MRMVVVVGEVTVSIGRSRGHRARRTIPAAAAAAAIAAAVAVADADDSPPAQNTSLVRFAFSGGGKGGARRTRGVIAALVQIVVLVVHVLLVVLLRLQVVHGENIYRFGVFKPELLPCAGCGGGHRPSTHRER